MGQDPLLCRLLRGMHLTRPPGPLYSSLWDVSTIFALLQGWPDNDDLSLKQLSAKLALLLCLLSFRRVSDVRAFDYDGVSFSPQGVTFAVSRRTKTHCTSVSYPYLSADPSLCVVRCLSSYLARTESSCSPSAHKLLISFVKPFKPVSCTTIARWIRWLLTLAAIDRSFGAHSVRGAAASAADSAGGSIADIMRVADWSRESTFRTFYVRPSPHVANVLLS